MTILTFRRRKPAEHIGATDTSTVLPAPEAYVGRHRSGLQAEWKPVHTPGRHREQHARPAGERPDLRIEKTVGLSFAEIRQMLARGAR